MKRVAVLGSTGSIGQNTLKVIRALGNGYSVAAIAANTGVETLRAQADETGAPLAALLDPSAARAYEKSPGRRRPKIFAGFDGLAAMLEEARPDIVVVALVGAAALKPALAAARLGCRLALANKECLVMAGHLLAAACAKSGAEIVPVDSEHSAVFQILKGHGDGPVRRIILTASGGPFWRADAAAIARATVAEALAHPNWRMGKKITVDSATFMNKALEVVEARWIFSLPPERIAILVHPQSIVHALVEFEDGSTFAHMGRPDMRVPIQYALTHPSRLRGDVEPIDLAKVGTLSFEEPDPVRFPAVRFGHRVAREGGTSGAVLNGANEAAVALFLEGKIPLPEIAARVERALDRRPRGEGATLEEILEADRFGRESAGGPAR